VKPNIAAKVVNNLVDVKSNIAANPISTVLNFYPILNCHRELVSFEPSKADMNLSPI
jgi:hypothetical protein